MRHLRMPLLLAAAAIAVAAASTGARAGAPYRFDHEDPFECTEPVPEAAAVPALGGPLSLDVSMLVDGTVTPARAEAIASAAAASYRAIGVTMRVVETRSIDFSSRDIFDVMRQTKAAYGGRRPAGVDLVYALTGRDLTVFIPELNFSSPAVAGLADCVGGVRHPHHAFAVGEDLNYSCRLMSVQFCGATGALVMAHELGHLLGGHHHYANCAEGVPSEIEQLQVSPCTLMSNFADFNSGNFSTFNGAVVRGYAERHARP